MEVRLRGHRVAILKDLEPKKHWNYLIQEGVLDYDDLDDLKAEKTRKARAELLLGKVLLAGAQKINIFVKSLRIYQPHLNELLRTDLPETLQRQQEIYPFLYIGPYAYRLREKRRDRGGEGGQSGKGGQGGRGSQGGGGGVEIYDAVAPIESRWLKHRPYAPWYSGDLRQVKHEKRRLERKYRKSGLPVEKQLFEDKCLEMYQPSRTLRSASRSLRCATFFYFFCLLGSTQATVGNVTQQLTGLHVHVQPAPFVRKALSPVEHGACENPFNTNVETSKISDQQSRQTTQPPLDEEQPFVSPTDLSKLPAHIHRNSEEVYPMFSKPRGIALIINIEIFFHNPEKTKKEEEKEQCSNRQGSDKDIEMLKKLFGALDFKVKIERNLKREEIYKVLDNISYEDHSNYDCFVLCLMSHGLEGFVYGADGERVLLETVRGFFSNSRCSTLKGKPKLFVIQACRGNDKDKGVVKDSPGSPETLPGNPVTEAAISSGSADGEDDVADRGFHFSIPQYIPDQADMLMAYSTVSGY
ncbi:unnamed protein product, partial [Porites evermanni]